MEDLEPHILSDAIEWVYTALFCNHSVQQLPHQPEKILFSCFMTTLSDAFEWKLTLENERYESGSESLNIPTPVHRTPCLYLSKWSENLSFDPATPCPHWPYSPQWHRSLSSVCCHLTFSNDEENPSTDSSPLHGRAEQSSSVKQQMVYHHTDDSFQNATIEQGEEDFPTAPLDDNVWLEEPVPDRHFCIHEQSQPHDQCP